MKLLLTFFLLASLNSVAFAQSSFNVRAGACTKTYCNNNMGTGFVAGMDDEYCYALTAFHTVKDNYQAVGVFQGGQEFKIQVGSRSHNSRTNIDVRSLQWRKGITPPGMQVAYLDVEPVKEGDRLTLATHRRPNLTSNEMVVVSKVIDSAIYFLPRPVGGDSGSPLIDGNGRVRGLVTAVAKTKFEGDRYYRSYGQAMPSKKVWDLMVSGSDRKVMAFTPIKPVVEPKPEPTPEPPAKPKPEPKPEPKPTLACDHSEIIELIRSLESKVEEIPPCDIEPVLEAVRMLQHAMLQSRTEFSERLGGVHQGVTELKDQLQLLSEATSGNAGQFEVVNQGIHELGDSVATNTSLILELGDPKEPDPQNDKLILVFSGILTALVSFVLGYAANSRAPTPEKD